MDNLIKQLRDKYDLTQEQLAERLDISREYVNKMENGKMDISLKTKEKISENFPYFKVKNVSRATLQEPEQSYTEKRRNQKNGSEAKGIPVFESAPSTLSNVEVYRDEKQTSPDFWVTIPFLRDCDYGSRAKGESMYPLIRSNALIIGKQIHDLSVIIFGEIYTVKTKSGMETTKYIHPHPENPDMVLLVPYNEKAKSTPIHKDDILALYEAKAVFNNL